MTDKPIIRRGPRPASESEAAAPAASAPVSTKPSAPPPSARKREAAAAEPAPASLPGYDADATGLFGWSAQARGAPPRRELQDDQGGDHRPRRDDAHHAAPARGPRAGGPADRGGAPPDRRGPPPDRRGPPPDRRGPPPEASARPRPDRELRDLISREPEEKPGRDSGRGEGRRDRRTEADLTVPEPISFASLADVPVAARLTELEAIASGGMDMAALLAGGGPVSTKLPDIGTRVRGVVSAVNSDEVHVDLGLRMAGVLSRRERPDAKIGDEVSAYVVGVDDVSVELSARLSGAAASVHLEDAKDSGIPVEGVVSSRNSGGYEVKIGGTRAFCPTKHISRLPLLDPDSVLGATLPFLVLETDEKIIVSHRALADRDLDTARDAFWETAREGDKITATVTSVSSWGAWVDLDGVEAKLSRRDFGWEEIDDLTTRLVRGQKLEVRISELDAAGRKLRVSTRDPSLDPWLVAEEKLSVGSVITGRVMGQAEYGAFVEVLPGLQGLLHASRMGGDTLPTPGTSVEVRVLSVDPRSRRIELAPRSFDPAAQKAHTVGVTVTGKATDVDQRGVRVQLDDGRSAWLPAGEVELSAGQLLAHRFRVGHTVTARIKSEGPSVTLTQKADDGAEQASWRLAASSAKGSSMGTLADLFSRARR
jgi:small subunit ribosomal protein S1